MTEEALALWREVDDRKQLASSLILLGLLYDTQGEPEGARLLYEESLALARELGNQSAIANALFMLAEGHFLSQGDPMTVRSRLEEVLALYSEVGNKPGIANYFYLSARLALSQGDVITARRFSEECVRLNRELGDPNRIAFSLSVLAEVETSQGNYSTARSLYEEGLAIASKARDKEYITFYQEELAGVIAAQGESVWAARLWGAAEVLREAIGAPQPQPVRLRAAVTRRAEVLREAIGAPQPPFDRVSYERSITATRARLGEKSFAAAWAEGRSMTPEQALAVRGRELMPKAASTGQPLIPSAKSSSTHPDGLTTREVEVLRLVAQGLTDAQVAEQLVISPRTVNTHLTAIYGKIGRSSRAAATRYAIEHHLI
jgi:ATP/maltotriose-dependent transcriptional regulator MalT